MIFYLHIGVWYLNRDFNWKYIPCSNQLLTTFRHLNTHTCPPNQHYNEAVWENHGSTFTPIVLRTTTLNACDVDDRTK